MRVLFGNGCNLTVVNLNIVIHAYVVRR